jgi:hypothetical protein
VNQPVSVVFLRYENGFSQKKEKGKNICTSRSIAIFFLVVSNLLPSKTKFFKKQKLTNLPQNGFNDEVFPLQIFTT